MSGPITALSSGSVSFSYYGVTAVVPYYQGTFTVGGKTVTWSQLAVGQSVSANVTAFSGTVLSVSGVTVKFQSPQGWVVAPAQALPTSLQQAIYVNVKLTSGTQTTMTLYNALKSSTVSSILSLSS